MSDRMQNLLATRPWLLADGATGTNFFARGLETGALSLDGVAAAVDSLAAEAFRAGAQRMGTQLGETGKAANKAVNVNRSTQERGY